MGKKIHQVKNIAVRLPKELEGPETVRNTSILSITFRNDPASSQIFDTFFLPPSESTK